MACGERRFCGLRRRHHPRRSNSLLRPRGLNTLPCAVPHCGSQCRPTGRANGARQEKASSPTLRISISSLHGFFVMMQNTAGIATILCRGHSVPAEVRASHRRARDVQAVGAACLLGRTTHPGEWLGRPRHTLLACDMPKRGDDPESGQCPVTTPRGSATGPTPSHHPALLREPPTALKWHHTCCPWAPTRRGSTSTARGSADDYSEHLPRE